MRLLVTGGAGFIGSHFVRYLLDRYPDYRIINLDKLTYAGNRENLRDVARHPRHRFIKGDICNRPLVARLSRQVDAIVNFAADTHVDRSITRPASFLQTDVIGAGVLLDAARRCGHGRYLQISTDEVYGSIEQGYADEAAPLRPGNPYSASKAGADLLVLAYGRTYGLPVLISRCSNNYGPYQYPEKLIPLCITNGLEGLPLPLYGDGQYRRDWIHVSDHCRAVDLVLHHGIPGSVYNVGGGHELPNVDVVHRIAAALNLPASAIQFVADRPGHDRRYAVKDEKLRALGYRPVTSFDEGLAETIRWYQAHRGWWKKIRAGAFRRYYRQRYHTSRAGKGAVSGFKPQVPATHSRTEKSR
ncbi:MAG: dTDP-glucose 4,6-dehydratase [Nitrospirae bacterium]|nr:dTDP-glucose 4,6-dehydratase [Nitrospirota bacterium]